MTASTRSFFLIPRLHNPGGVSNYYSALKPFLNKNITYLYRGKDGKENKIVRTLLDYFEFIKTVKNRREKGIVVINHSLGKGSFFRDAVYTFLTPKKYKQIIFFRGWNPEYEKKIDKSWLHKKWLAFTFLKADHFIVLASAFKGKLIEWGYKRSVTIETTLVEEQLLDEETLISLSDSRANLNETRLLYLGNISKAKGVWEIIKSLDYLAKGSGDRIKLTLAGEGKELNSLQQYSEENNLNVEFPGFVRQENKAQAFQKAHLYVFPSVHGEGMPNSVLEAMAFGLPVITTRVGGIPDFFEEGKMGLFLENRNPEHIAEKVQYLLNRPRLMKQMSEYNYNYAKEHFYASKVARRLEDIIESVVKEEE